jgi:hypothetical protein
LSAAAARNGGKNSVAGVAVKRVSLRPDHERIESGGVAQVEVRRSEFYRRFVQFVDIPSVRPLSGGDTMKQMASCAVTQLRDQRYFDRELILCIRNDDRWESVNDACQVRHRTLQPQNAKFEHMTLHNFGDGSKLSQIRQCVL